MGRWPYSNKWTVEESKTITAQFLNKYKYFESGVRYGGMTWSRNGKKTGNIGFVVSTKKGDEYIRFMYTQTNSDTGKTIEMDYKVQLVWTPCYFGGRRWWFICPIVINGQPCHRRVGTLHLATDSYFGCRHCHNLTYESSKESHKFDKLYRYLGITEKQARQRFISRR